MGGQNPAVPVDLDSAEGLLYQIYATVPREQPLFGLEEITYYAQITERGQDEAAVDDLGFGTTIDVLVRALDSMIVRVSRGLEDNDLVQLVVSNPGSLDYPIHIPLTKKKDLNVSLVLDHLIHVLQSNNEFRLTDQLWLEVTTIRMPLVGIFAGKQYIVEEKWIKASSAIIIIK